MHLSSLHHCIIVLFLCYSKVPNAQSHGKLLDSGNTPGAGNLPSGRCRAPEKYGNFDRDVLALKSTVYYNSAFVFLIFVNDDISCSNKILLVYDTNITCYYTVIIHIVVF